MITMETIERISQRVRELPVLDQGLTTAEAIKKLAPSIRQMQAKGYSLDQIATTLSAEGLRVAGSTLKRLMRSPAAKPKTKAAQ